MEYVLELIELNYPVVQIAEMTCWPPRQIQQLGERFGFLFSADGTPYKPTTRRKR